MILQTVGGTVSGIAFLVLGPTAWQTAVAPISIVNFS